jgi:ferredoxin-like protein FixX
MEEKLKIGQKYDVTKLRKGFISWRGDHSLRPKGVMARDLCEFEDFFDSNGAYLGPNKYGIEPECVKDMSDWIEANKPKLGSQCTICRGSFIEAHPAIYDNTTEEFRYRHPRLIECPTCLIVCDDYT